MKKYTNLNRTKIIATIGPSSANYDVMLGLAKAGMSVARINMSHGNVEYYENIKNIVNKVNANSEYRIGLMTDTKGPEIRIGTLTNPLVIKQNDVVTIKTKSFETPTQPLTFYVYDSTKKYNMANDIKVGNRILVDDGKLQLVTKTVDAKKGIITAVAANAHTVVTNKRINLPDSHYSMTFLSEQDKKNLVDTINLGASYCALSFVNTAKDVNDVRAHLEKNKKNNGIKLFSKIETQQALDNIDAIIKASDGILIARGDLALETPFYNIPSHELEIIELCKKAGKPVIVATQMLDSLEKSLQPTRAEVTDVYFACVNGTDCTMLSGETASGLYPVQALGTMTKINSVSENCFDFDKHYKNIFAKMKFAPAIKKQVAKFVADIKKNKKQVFEVKTNDENLVKAISAARLPALAIIVTSNKEFINKFDCHYGIRVEYNPKI